MIQRIDIDASFLGQGYNGERVEPVAVDLKTLQPSR
jgi:hypothetical protein